MKLVCWLIMSAAFTMLAIDTTASADEGAADWAKSREVTVGKTRAVLLKVNLSLDYSGDGKKPVQSLEVSYLVEQLDKAKIGPVQSGLGVFASGTTDPGVRSVGPKSLDLVTTNDSYEGYEKRFYTQLPPVKAKDRGVVMFQALRNVERTARQLDLKLRVGLHKGESHTVWFKGVTFE